MTNYCSNSDWFYDNDWSTCQNECSYGMCNIDYYTKEYCCPLVYSTRHNSSGPWWIAIIFVVVFIMAFVLSCWQMQMRRKRMLMMMGAQQRMVMGNGIVTNVVQPAVVYTQPMQQQQMMPQNYPSNMPPMSQNSQISMPAVM
ncbi:Hypothetical_protein [Hexamita inflata]|uniref:Hypothetical_protein n=1 Tax=Hexamita inflata TaxID=28002 RepID=A0AA86V153_9EUKA|nr:Hypothetical protein HINF_LOCUS27416 [Hexamita inflata]CAI9972162.1 Hypothetical protein HINF_LOCUS59807 [Hexamita inflata]